MDELVSLFEKFPELAVIISLAASVVIAVLGLVPSVFITAANILFFGFWPGTFLSFLGEVIGACVAFYLYRAGFKKITVARLEKFKHARLLLQATGYKAFSLIFILRLLPFVPSGIVTFAAAIGKVSAGIFIVASSLGKIPSLLIEAYSVNQIVLLTWQGKLIMSILLMALLVFVIRRLRSAYTTGDKA